MVFLHGKILQMTFGRHLRWKKQVAKSSPRVKYVKFVALMFEADIPPNVSHLELQHVRNVLGSIWVKQLSHFHNTRFQGFVCNFFKEWNDTSKTMIPPLTWHFCDCDLLGMVIFEPFKGCESWPPTRIFLNVTGLNQLIPYISGDFKWLFLSSWNNLLSWVWRQRLHQHFPPKMLGDKKTFDDFKEKQPRTMQVFDGTNGDTWHKNRLTQVLFVREVWNLGN